MRQFYLVVLLAIFSSFYAQAQINIGGTPPSFGTQFKSLAPERQVFAQETITAIDVVLAHREDAERGNSNRFAKAVAVDYSPSNSGTWATLPNGDRVWRLGIKSEEATCLRVLFERYRVPVGARVYLYSADRQYVLGGYTDANNSPHGQLGTDIIPTNDMVIEYYEPKKVAFAGEILIKRVDVGYKRLPQAYQPNRIIPKAAFDGFGESGACNINVNCNTGANWQDEKRGVLKITLTTATGSSWCTGSLINNTAVNGVPLVLTANHCEDDGGQAFISTWVFVFNYEAANCTPNTPATEPSRTQSVAGATILANNSTDNIGADMLLLRLNNTIPSTYNHYFNGWNRATAISGSVTCIHHPSGDIKKISVDSDSPSTTQIGSNTANSNATYWRVVWNQGVTEGGSSGSPLFDNQGRIIGQLYGGGSDCANATAPDWYGKISTSWEGSTNATRLRDWLDPRNTGATSLNGVYANLATGGIEDVQLRQITISPVPFAEVLRMSAKDYPLSDRLEVLISDMGGKSYLQTTWDTRQQPDWAWDTSDLPVGVYVVRLKSAQGSYTRKIVKQ